MWVQVIPCKADSYGCPSCEPSSRNYGIAARESAVLEEQTLKKHMLACVPSFG